MRVTPNGRYALGAMGRGAVVVDVARAASRTADPVLGALTGPHISGLAAPRAAEIAVSADSRYVFVTLEGAGAVAVFDLRAAASGGFGSAGFLGSIPVGAGALGIATSPDGKWLYEVSESGGGGSRKGLGTLNVIDLSRAVKDPAHSVVATAAVPCAPVRVAVSRTGDTVWVTARDADALLGFSAAALRRRGADALISIIRVGSQPLGVALVADGRRALVCDSDLSDSRHSRSAVSVIDISSPTRPVLLGSIPAGNLADAISTPATAGIAQVTASAIKQLDVLDLQRLP
jgi:DNA-binding beta-propeller fold protein YncE